MASPLNPFAGLSQVDGPASGGRGRGSHGRAGSHVSRNPNTPRGGHHRGRGRGTPPAGRSSRGRGATRGATSSTWHRKSDSTPGHESAGSPFAQLKQNKPASPFGGPPPQNSPFGPAAKTSGWPGAVTSGGTVNLSRDPRLRDSERPTNGTSEIPVENAAILNRYNDRYEQVGVF
ncbi:MCM3-associated protein [Aspergillus sclerotialis]|uniref:MCM3-associated protein n=1 Tax=Aspergillus sclerotialis TaxID=2070753 RepID=A0A3A2ZSP2_9EURO|nr:MCM3-associated protein [Aspergillus sclerotialis]